jgi:hypothetical protein
MAKLLLEGPENPESCEGCDLYSVWFTSERNFTYCVNTYAVEGQHGECVPGPKCLEAQKAAELRQIRTAWAQHWLDEQCKQHGIVVPPPYIVPYDSDDPTEILLEWWKDLRKLSLYLTFGGAWYIKIWGPNIDTEMEEGHIENSFPELWAWLNGETSDNGEDEWRLDILELLYQHHIDSDNPSNTGLSLNGIRIAMRGEVELVKKALKGLLDSGLVEPVTYGYRISEAGIKAREQST